MVRTNVFLRLLDYRVNLADEINADIQRLVSRSTAAGMIERSLPSSASKKSRRIPVNKHRESHDEEKSSKHSPPQSTVLAEPVNETKKETDGDHAEHAHPTDSRELSTKFRTIVQQHRKMIKQLNETDEFVPFLDRKVKSNYRSFSFLLVHLG